MRTALALTLLISTTAFAKLDLALMPIGAIGEGAKLEVTSRVLLPANSEEVSFDKILVGSNETYILYSCDLYYFKSIRLRSINVGTVLEINESTSNESSSSLSIAQDTGLYCRAKSFTTNANPRLVSAQAIKDGHITIENEVEREMTVQEFNSQMPFRLSVEDITEFNVNEDENEETIEESVSTNTLNNGASQEGFILPPPPAP
jgi:hypothetical protein